jgi:hypothetical protein
MPRSGTTLVEQILSSHARVDAGGEPTFWSESFPTLAEFAPTKVSPALTRNLATDYLAVLRSISPAAERVTDKMPGNCQLLGPIHLIFPQARIIHCRRNPIGTCLSIYFTHFAALKNFGCDRADIVFFYEQYLRLMAHWRSVLPADRFLEIDYEALVADHERPLRMLEIDYEKLVADLQGESRRLLSFMGLEWDPVCLEFHRTERTVATSSSWQVRQPLYDRSVGRWRNYERYLAPMLRALSADDDACETSAVDLAIRRLENEVAAALSAAAEDYQAGNLDGAETRYCEVLEKMP